MESGAVSNPGNANFRDTKDSGIVAQTNSLTPAQSQTIVDLSRITPAESLPPSAESSVELLKALHQTGKDWNKLNKSQKAARLEAVCSTIERLIQNNSELILDRISNLPSLKEEHFKSMSVSELRDLVEKEITAEAEIRQLVDVLSAAVYELKAGPVDKGKKEFLSSNGALDSWPGVSSSLATAFGVTGLTLGAWASHKLHHVPFHIAEIATSAVFGHEGLLAKAAGCAGAFTGFIGFVVGVTILLGSGAAGGAKLYGALETAAGTIKRTLFRSAETEFKKEAVAANSLQQRITSTAQNASEHLLKVYAALGKFYERNNTLRAISKLSVWEESVKGNKFKECQKLENEMAALGAHETIDLWLGITAQQKIDVLARTDIRSPLIRAAEPDEIKHTKQSLILRVKGLARLGLRSVKNINDASSSVGVESAINAVAEIHHNLDAMPRSYLDSFAGLGSELSSTIGLVIESGGKPEQAVLEALTEGIAIFNYGKDVKHGPGWGEIGSYVVAYEEFKNSSKFRWAGTFLVRFGLAVFKKPFILIKLGKKAAEKGEVSPQYLNKELEQTRGRFSAFLFGCREIAESLQQAIIGAARKNFVELPLTRLAKNKLRSGVTSNLLPSSLPGTLHKFYEKKIRKTMVELRHIRKSIRNGGRLDNLSTNELKSECMKALIDFNSGKPGSSYKEMKQIIRYWEKSEYLWRLQRKERELKLIKDISDLKKELHSAIKKIKAGRPFNQGSIRKAGRQSFIIDNTSDGEVILYSSQEGLQKLDASQIRKKIMDDFYSPARNDQPSNLVLMNADQARIAVIESVTGPLESIQRRAIMEAHHRIKDGNFYNHVKLLIRSNMMKELLLGHESWVQDQSGFPGLFRLGLIGNAIPSEKIIQQTRDRLKAERVI